VHRVRIVLPGEHNSRDAVRNRAKCIGDGSRGCGYSGGEIAFIQPVTEVLGQLNLRSILLPAIEIVDSRIADWKITIADTVADNASSAFFVIGSEPRSLMGLDLMSCGMVLTIDGMIVSLGAGAACLGHPLNAVMWLARELAARGDPLRAGDVVMSGALGPMVQLPEDALVSVAIGGLGSAEFSYRRSQS
jgi:2-keto-4-pentenoate hydratase